MPNSSGGPRVGACGCRRRRSPTRTTASASLNEKSSTGSLLPCRRTAARSSTWPGFLGLRWSECVGLRVGRIDFLKRTLTVAETIAEVGGVLVPAPVKTKASRRTLAVPPFLVDLLAAHLAATGRTAHDALVFQSTEGGRYGPRTGGGVCGHLRRSWRALRD